MALYLHTGPAGSGKTRRLFETVIESAARDTDRNVILVVPEQFSMQTTTELINLHPAHGIMNIDVLSFMRLAYRVFEELGIKQPVILEDTGKSMIVKKVALDLADRLTLYKGLVHRQGFIDELKSVISEFYQYGITPERLDEMIEQTASSRGRLSKKLEDVRLIFNGFRDFLKDKYIMNEELLDLLADVTGDSKVLDGAVFAFDGYTGFTVAQYRLIDALMKVASDIHVNVTIDNNMVDKDVNDESMFYLSATTIRKLVELADANHLEVVFDNDAQKAYRYGSSDSPLSHLERNIFRFPYQKSACHDGIFINSCESLGEELDLAITQIRRLVMDGKCRYGEVAVVLGDMSSFSRLARSRFEKAGIPFFIDEKKNIIGTKPVEMIRALIGIAESDYSYESVFRFLKAVIGDDFGDISALENYVTARGVRGRKRWHENWNYDTKKGYTRYKVDIDEINRQRELFVSLTDSAVEVLCAAKSTVSERIAALYELLEKARVREFLDMSVIEDSESPDDKVRLRARENAQLFDTIEEVLDGIDTLLGSDVISLHEFREILDTGFSEAKLALLPPGNDAVLIGDVERSRITAVKVLFMVGINEDVIPKRSTGGGILSDSDRCILLEEGGITLSPTKRQAVYLGEFYMYLAFTKPSQALYISYHRMNGDKSQGRPAYVVSKVTKLFDGLVANAVYADSPELFVGADGGEASTAKIINKFLLDCGSECDGRSCEVAEEIDAGEQEDGYRSAKESFSGKLSLRELTLLTHIRKTNGRLFDSLLAGAFYKNGGTDISPQMAKQIYSDVLTGSVTSLERYAGCAYAHFLRYGLMCEEKKEYRIGGLELGLIYHKAFEKYCSSMKEDGRSWHDVLEEEEQKDRINNALTAALDDYSEIMSDSARNSYMRTRIGKVLRMTVDTVDAQIKAGDFEPESFEQQFDVAGAFMKLRGTIDRIDVCHRGNKTYLRVIDYKTGSKDFDYTQLYNGLQIQLVLYMKMARELAGKSTGGEVMPSGLYYYNVDDPIIDASLTASADEIEAKRKKTLQLKGLTNSENDIVIGNDRNFEDFDENNNRRETLKAQIESSVIPVATKKDATFTITSRVAESAELLMLEEYIDTLMSEESTKILGGSIPVNPYRLDKKSACEYCAYVGICGFDESLGCHYREIEKLDDAEAKQKMASRIKG